MAFRWLTKRKDKGVAHEADGGNAEGTRNSSLNIDALGLTIWAEPSFPEVAVVDIVFVHGLTGKRASTWTSKGDVLPWPQTLLAEAFKEARIMGYGYDADVIRFLGPVSQNSLRDHAQNLVMSLCNRRPLGYDRPVVLVAHSLGGLLCEQAVLVAGSSPETYQRALGNAVKGIIFFGTPHSGSGWVSLAKGITSLAGLSIIKKPNKGLLQVLDRHSDTLVALQGDFSALNRNRSLDNVPGASEILILCFHEELPVKGLIVSRSSAKYPGYCEEAGIHGDHMSMTRFKGSDEEGFQMTCGVISRWLAGTSISEPPGRHVLRPANIGAVQAEYTPHIVENDSSRKVESSHKESSKSNPAGVNDGLKERYQISSNREQQTDFYSTMGSQQVSSRESTQSLSFYRYPNRMAHFIPRKELVKEITERLEAATNFNPPTVILSGMGGQGKTQLALEFCMLSEQKRSYEVILWLNASSKQSLEQSFDRYWHLIKHPHQISNSLKDRITDMQNNISNWPMKWLLVFDNYDDPESFRDVRQYMARGLNGSIIVTSRRIGLQRTGLTVPIPGLSAESCVNLLFDRTYNDAPRTVQNITLAKEIAQRLGFLALALDQARAYIGARGLSFEEFLEHFDKRKRKVLCELPADWEYRKDNMGQADTALSVYTTWELSFECLDRRSNGGPKSKAGLLVFLALLDFRSISGEIFQAPVDLNFIKSDAQQRLPDELKPFVSKGLWKFEVLEDTLGELSKLSLIQDYSRMGRQGFRKFSMHPLICDWIRLRSSRSQQLQCFEQAVQLVLGCCYAHLGSWDSAQENTAQGDGTCLSFSGEEEARRHLAALITCEMDTSEARHQDQLVMDRKKQLWSVGDQMERIRYNRLNQHRNNVADWLTMETYDNKRLNARRKTPTDLVDWFVEGQTFRWWSDSHASRLRCTGTVGAGKTVLAETVVRTLRFSSSSRNLVIEVYFSDNNIDFTEDQAIRCLLRQLFIAATRSGDKQGELELFLSGLFAEARSNLQLEDLVDALQIACSESVRVYVVVDAFDTLSFKERNIFLRIIDHEDIRSYASVMITTRPIVEYFGQSWTEELLPPSDRISYLDPEYWEAQLTRTLTHDIRHGRDGVLAARVISCLYVHSMGRLARQLSLSELCQAVTVHIHRSPLNLGVMLKASRLGNAQPEAHTTASTSCSTDDPISDGGSISPERIVDAGNGLFITDQSQQSLRWAHWTLESYVTTTPLRGRFNTVDADFLQKACLVFLNASLWAPFGPCPDATLPDRLLAFPFLRYASLYWGYDPLSSNYEESYQTAAAKFLINSERRQAILQVVVHLDFVDSPLHGILPDSPPLHVAAILGLSGVIGVLLHHGCSPGDVDRQGQTALSVAEAKLGSIKASSTAQTERESRVRIGLMACITMLKQAQNGVFESGFVPIPPQITFKSTPKRLHRTHSSRSIFHR